MAYLHVERQDTHMVIRSQDFCVTLTDTWANQNVLFVRLHALHAPNTGKPLFTYQQVADVFGDVHRQNIHNFQQECERCSEDFAADLTRTRKVAAAVVEAVTAGIRQSPLASASERCRQVSTRLGRTDLTPANMHTARLEVPCPVIRPVLQQQWEAGTFHPKEAVLRQNALAALLSSSTTSLVVEEMQQTGVVPAASSDEMPVQRQQGETVSRLLPPQAPGEQVSAPIRRMVVALTLYYWNVP